MKKLRTKLCASVLILALVSQFFPTSVFANDDQYVAPSEETGIVQELEAETPEETPAEETALTEQPEAENAAPETASEEQEEEPAEEPEDLPAEEPEETALPEVSSASEKQVGTKEEKDSGVVVNVWAEVTTYNNKERDILYTYDGQPHTWGGDDSYTVKFYKQSNKDSAPIEITLADVQALGFTVDVHARHMDGTEDNVFEVSNANVYCGGGTDPLNMTKPFRPYYTVVVTIGGKVDGYEAKEGASGRVELIIAPAPVKVKFTGKTQTITYDGKYHNPVSLYDVTVLEDPTGLFNPESLYLMLKSTLFNAPTYAGEYATGPSKSTLEKSLGNDDSNFVVAECEAEQGLLTVNRAPLTVTTGSKTANITQTTDLYSDPDDYTIEGLQTHVAAMSLPDGAVYALDKVDVKMTGHRSGVGTSENTCDVIFENDKLKNSYEVTYKYGSLTITGEKDVLITIDCAANKTVLYNGEVQTLTARAEDFKISIDNKNYSEDNIRFVGNVVFVEGKDAGTYNLQFGPDLFEWAGEEDGWNVDFELHAGELVIEPKGLAVHTGSASAAFDPENPDMELTCDEATIEGLVRGEDVTITATGSQKGIGKSENTYEIDWGDVSEDNYIIDKLDIGMLEIYDALVQVDLIPCEEQTVTYNGSEQEVVLWYTLETKNADFDLSTVQYTGDDYVIEEGKEGELFLVTTLRVTDVGDYKAEVDLSKLISTDDYYHVSFVIAQEAVVYVTGVEVTVYIYPNQRDMEYTGEEITIPSYELGWIDQQNRDVELYSEDKFEYTGNMTISGTEIGYYIEDLKPEKFENKDGNYDVTFVIDARQTTAFLYIGQPIITVELQLNDFETVYNGQEHELTVLKNGTVKLNGKKQSVLAFEVVNVKNETGMAFDAGKITLRETVTLSGTDAGTYTDKTLSNYLQYPDNSVRVQFLIQGKLSLQINAAEAKLIVDNAETYYGMADAPQFTAHYEGLKGNDAGPAYTLVSGGEKEGIGSYPITVDGLKDDNTFKSGNYIITVVPGTLKVKALPITFTVTFKSAKLPYTGTDQTVIGFETSTECTVEGAASNIEYNIKDLSNFEELDKLSVLVHDIGTYTFEVDDASKYENTNPNFKVKVVFVSGTVEVTDELIDLGGVRFFDSEVTYDGELHGVDYEFITPNNYTVTGVPIVYDGWTAGNVHAITHISAGVSDAGTYTATSDFGVTGSDKRNFKVVDENGVDITAICTIDNEACIPGTLTIRQLSITVKINGSKLHARYTARTYTVTGFTAEVTDAAGNPVTIYPTDTLSTRYMLYNNSTTMPQLSSKNSGHYYYGLNAGRFSNKNSNFIVSFIVESDLELWVELLAGASTLPKVRPSMNNQTVTYNGQNQTFDLKLVDAYGNEVKPGVGDSMDVRGSDGRIYTVTFSSIRYNTVTKKAVGTYQASVTGMYYSSIVDEDGYLVYNEKAPSASSFVQTYSTADGGGKFTIAKMEKIHLKVRINSDITKEYGEVDPDKSTWVTIVEGELLPGDKIEEVLNMWRDQGENVGKYPIHVQLNTWMEWTGGGGWEWPIEEKDAKSVLNPSVKRVPAEEAEQPGYSSFTEGGYYYYDLEIEDANTTKYLEITPIPLVITAIDDSKEYKNPHNPDPTWRATVEGLIGSEVLPDNFYIEWRDPGEEIGDYPIRLDYDPDYVEVVPYIPGDDIIDVPGIIDDPEVPIYEEHDEEEEEAEQEYAAKSASAIVFGGEDEVAPSDPGIIPKPIELKEISVGGGSGYFWSGNYEIKLINGNFNIYGDKPDTPTTPDTPVTPPTPPTTPDTPVTPPTPPTTPDNPNPPTETTPDPTPPVPEEIQEESLPTAGLGNRAWALLNLLCTIATAITAILMIVTYFRNKDEDDEEQQEDGVVRYTETDDEEEEEEKKRRKSKFLGLIPAIGAVIAFILTEDMRLPMIFIDKWTPLMVVILVVGLVLALVTRNKDDEDEDEEKGRQINSVADPAAAH